jgi:hypothetical protein
VEELPALNAIIESYEKTLFQQIDKDFINLLSRQCFELERYGIRPPKHYDLMPFDEWVKWIANKQKEFSNKRPWFKIRRSVLERDKYTCRMCGATWHMAELHIHHKIPKSLGGKNNIENLITLCNICHIPKTHKINYKEISKIILENYKKYHKEDDWSGLGWGQ